jgi:hypothetical protein
MHLQVNYIQDLLCYIIHLKYGQCFLQHKCDLINMSYGEPTLLPDYGRFVDLVNEVSNLNFVNSCWMIIFVYSFPSFVFHAL